MGDMPSSTAGLAARSTFTERQIEVLRRRARGQTQQEIATEFGTTASNISRIEAAAETNIDKAHRTIDVARLIHAAVRFQAAPGTEFDTLVDLIYEHGDTADIVIEYARPKLYAYLYSELAEVAADNTLQESVEVGITEAGELSVAVDAPPPD